ncbi:MAG: trehalose-phosphatase [Gammaproteobacteria bacterium]
MPVAEQNTLRQCASLAFFLDVDGTLLAIAETPDAVSPSAFVCTTLTDLAHLADGAVALVSGRPLAELDRLFAPHRFPAAGQHGGERRDAQGRVTRANASVTALDEMRHLMQELADRDDQLILEDKGLSVALHYRRAPKLGQMLIARVRDAVDRHPDVVLQLGKQVLEVRPANISKTHAVRDFMQEPPFSGRVPVFIGDDLTDEDGFAMVNSLNGISIKVGPGRSIAQYRLADPAAVLRWLVSCTAGAPECLKAI